MLTRPIRLGVDCPAIRPDGQVCDGAAPGTAEAEAILRRFTRANGPQHPTYRALCELGKVVKTIFLCEYLQSESCAARSMTR